MDMTKKWQEAAPPKTQFEISPGALEFLLMHAIRDPVVFQLCHDEMTADMLSQPNEMPYRHIWKSILEFHEEHGKIPGRESLSLRALAAIENDPLSKADPATGVQLFENALQFIEFCYDKQVNPDAAMEPHEAKVVLRHVLTDRGPEADIRRAVDYAVGRRISELPAIVEKAQQRILDISSLGTIEDTFTTIPTNWDKVSKPKWPTGIGFIDSVMEGGSSPGDCNVIIGPTGGGKTTVAIQLACSTARLQSQLGRRGTDGEPGLVVFVSYEDDREMLQIRASSCGARVSKDSLRCLESSSQLSSVGNLKEYEQLMYAREGRSSEMLGEAERLEQIRPWADKYLVLFDHHDPVKGGRGHVTEIAQKLTAIQQERGLPIRTVVIDWAGALVSNYLLAKYGSIDGGSMSLELQNLLNRAKQEIAAPFNCTVWVPHQLKGQLGKMSPARFPHHVEAQWCSSFADHAWYAFVLGTKDKEHNVCQFGATKTRHGTTPPPTILKIDGDYCRMIDVAEHFEVDDVTNRLSPRTDGAKMHTRIARQGQRQGRGSSDVDV